MFVERGFAATRLDEVAARAGVSKGTLYLYFSSKEELFKAVIRSGIVPLIERGERLLDEHRGTSSELLREIVFNWWASVGTTKLGGIPKLMFSECRNFPEIGKFYYDEVISRGHLLVQTVLERGMKSGEFRRMDANYAMRMIHRPAGLSVCCGVIRSISAIASASIPRNIWTSIWTWSSTDSDPAPAIEKKGEQPAKVISIEKKGENSMKRISFLAARCLRARPGPPT